MKSHGLISSELDELQAAVSRSNQYLYDGHMVRHPQWHWLKTLDIGTRLDNAVFLFTSQAEGNIRNVASWGGGLFGILAVIVYYLR